MKSKKNTFTFVLLALFLTSSAFAAKEKTFLCTNAQTPEDNFTLLLTQTIAPIAAKKMSERNTSDLNAILILDTRTKQAEQLDFVQSEEDINCKSQLSGQGGVLVWSGDGPNNWTYRIPAFAYSQKSFNIQYVFDVDSDGMDCRPAVYQCVEKSQ